MLYKRNQKLLYNLIKSWGYNVAKEALELASLLTVEVHSNVSAQMLCKYQWQRYYYQQMWSIIL